MAQTLTLKVKGLITNPNSFTPEVVDGALSYADNIVIDKDNIAESRRGFSKYNNYLSFSDYDGIINQMINYQDTILVHYDDATIAKDNGAGDWEDYTGSYSAPDTGFRLRGAEINQNLYACTSAGVKKISSVDATEFINAGVVKSLDGFGSTSGTTGWFENNKVVAYRMVWGIKDENQNLLLGAPSSRFSVANATGNTVDVALTFLIPAEITTDYFYQIYRSPNTEGLTDEPSDEMQLVVEGNPTSAEIAAKEFTVLDDVDPSLRGVTLYTSPSQQGIANANDTPPYCKDLAVYKNHLFYANTVTKQRYNLTLIGVGSPNGIQNDDTVTIDGVTYTGKAAEDVDNDEFLVSTDSSVSVAIEETALSLVKVINKSSSNTTVYAYYLSGFDDVPGKILIEDRSLGGDAWAVNSSRDTCWNPELPSTGTDESSDNETKVNRIYISKQQQPDAVPLYSYLDVGSANQQINRAIALRDSVFVFKDDGIYRITGETIDNFRVTLFDNTTKLLASESAVPFNNTVFAMTLQGVVSISDTGVAVVSRPIEQQLLRLIQYPNFASTTFAISYESERKYILFCVASDTQSFPTQAYVYNSFTNAWSRWSYVATCGLVNKDDDKLYLGGKLESYADAWVHKERKSFTTDDYVDDDWACYISAVTSSTQLVLSSTENAVEGYWIRQVDALTGVKTLAKITDVDSDTNTITVTPASANWSTDPSDASTIYKPITCRVKWVANTAQNPGIMKHFRDATLLFRQDSAATLDIGYETNYRPDYLYTTVATINAGNWGDFGWGTYPWGGLDPTFGQPLRVGIPRQKQRCMWISFSVEGSNAFSSFALGGISTNFEIVSERYGQNIT